MINSKTKNNDINFKRPSIYNSIFKLKNALNININIRLGYA